MDEKQSRSVVVTGAAGLLGSECVNALRKLGWDPLPWTRADLDLEFPDPGCDALRAARPAAVIHCAAETHVDKCEGEPQLADRVNEAATGALAGAARDVGARFVYIGSCGIFDGKKRTPYLETDSPQPLTRYALSKYRGELRALEADPANLICRVGWLFGGSRNQRKNFVEARRKEALTGKPMVSANDKWGSPTWAADAAQRIVELLEAGASGIFHVANSGIASRQDYVAAIVEAFDPTISVAGVDSSNFPRPAPVPDVEVLASGRLDEVGLQPLPDWRTALERYIQLEYPGNHLPS